MGLVPCPVCGTDLEVRVLEVAEEVGVKPDLLLLFDCPTGDYRGTVTRQDVAEIIADEVIRRWR